MERETQSAGSGSESLRLLREKARDGTLKDVLRDWKWILSFSRMYRLRILVYTLIGIVSSTLGLASGVLSKHLIDSIVALDRRRLLPLAVIMVGMGAFSVAFRSFSARFSARLGVEMQNTVRSRAFAGVMHGRWISLRQYATGDLLNRFSADVNTVAGCAVSWLPNVIIHLFTLAATLAVVLYYDPMMALIAFASTPVLFVLSRYFIRRQRDLNRQLREVSSHLSSFQADTLRNMDTLKSFGVEADVIRKMHSWQDVYRDAALTYNRFSVETGIWLAAMGTAVQYVAMGYCLWRLWRGEILFGTMVLFLQQRSQLSAAFSALVGQIPAALSGSVAAERLRELVELEPEVRSDRKPEIPAGGCALVLQNVAVAYEDGRQVVSGVELTAEAGALVALVGPSGEGKSTLMRLMLGLVSPAQGRAFLRDCRGNAYDLSPDTRHFIAYVPQGNTVLAGTVAENLRLVNPEVTEEEMIDALRAACAWEFVSRMPGGLHARLGEGGKGISEGQAQRIAIARALVRRAPVLLLDEVTSALDAETEQKVLTNLLERGVTTVAATHRPSVLSRCNRVYRVRDGAVSQLEEAEILQMQ